jgi:predicted oxidoreductase
MIKLWRQGKARAIGMSNYFVSQINELLQNSDVVPAVNQVEFHSFLSISIFAISIDFSVLDLLCATASANGEEINVLTLTL